MRHILADYLRLMRFPAGLATALTPVLGAISVGISTFSLLGPLLLIGFLSKIYGFVLNDYIDVTLDTLSTDLSQRSLVKGTVTKKGALVILTSCFFAAYILIFIFFYSNNITFLIALLCIIIADVLGLIYNIYGKRILGSDFCIALAESLLFLFGAFIVLGDRRIGILTWMLFLYIFIQVLYMNAVIGGLKDADHDYLMSAKTIALAVGVKVNSDKKVTIPTSFKTFGMGLQVFSAGLVFSLVVFSEIHYELLQIILLSMVLMVVIFTSWKMLTIQQFDRKKLRKSISSQLFLGSALFPLILVTVIGWFAAALLIIVPVTWYLFFSLLIGEKLFQPQI